MKRPALRGFTLVETIFSTLFISLTVLAIVNLFPGAYLSVKKSETRLQSDMIAQSIIEDLRDKSFEKLPPEGEYFAKVTKQERTEFVQVTNRGDWDSEYSQYGHSMDDVRYLCVVTIQNVDGTDPTVVKGVSVEITYRVGSLEQTNLHETYLHLLQ